MWQITADKSEAIIDDRYVDAKYAVHANNTSETLIRWKLIEIFGKDTGTAVEPEDDAADDK